KSSRFYLWRSSEAPVRYLRLLDKRFERITVQSLDEALLLPTLKSKHLIDICSPLAPAKWVESSALACLSKSIDAIVTGPLSKTAIRQSGFLQLGHTEI